MTKIDFVNGQEPALSAENLNQMQSNIETSINEVATDVGNAQTAITTLQGITKSVDANGWTKLEYGNGVIEFVKKGTLSVSLNGNAWENKKFSNFPVGYTSVTSDVILTTSTFSPDSAIAVTTGAGTNSGTRGVYCSCQNKYGTQVTSNIVIHARILVVPE